ncbi:hypothetical protein BDR07DRAFT_1372179 [Suillus spraguei]|nr:hypothetical protein BDR07DRAFT_1372179 [Suillus spraguei]
MDEFISVSIDPEDSVEYLSVSVFTFTGQNAPPPDDSMHFILTFFVERRLGEGRLHGTALSSALHVSGHITLAVGSSVPCATAYKHGQSGIKPCTITKLSLENNVL